MYEYYYGDEEDDLNDLLEGKVDKEGNRLVEDPKKKKPKTPLVEEGDGPDRDDYDVDDMKNFISDDEDDEDDDGTTAKKTNDDEEPKGDEAIEAPTKKAGPKRIVKNPQPKLDVDRLKSQRGLVGLLKEHEKIKFKGKGHELEDLNTLLLTLEHWGHRLFPKLAFDDFLEKVETLGHKKPVQVFVRKMRLGLPLDVHREFVDDASDEEDNVLRGENMPDLDAIFGPAPVQEVAHNPEQTESVSEVPVALDDIDFSESLSPEVDQDDQPMEEKTTD